MQKKFKFEIKWRKTDQNGNVSNCMKKQRKGEVPGETSVLYLFCARFGGGRRREEWLVRLIFKKKKFKERNRNLIDLTMQKRGRLEKENLMRKWVGWGFMYQSRWLRRWSHARFLWGRGERGVMVNFLKEL